MSKEIFETFAGQQDMFGYPQAVSVGDTICLGHRWNRRGSPHP
jgi:hypothetical protein